jgi:hypothetical protein
MKRAAIVCGALAAAVAGCNAIFGLEEVEPLEPGSGGSTASAGGGGDDPGGGDPGGGDAGGGGVGGGTAGSGGGGVHAGTCNDPEPLALPATLSGTTAGAADDLTSTCFASAGVERVHAFTAPETGRVLVRAAGLPDIGLQVRADCPDDPSPPTCCAVSPNDGCGAPAVESCVCAFDTYCCGGSWDAYCVSEASLYCNAVCATIGCTNFHAGDAFEQMLAPVKQGDTYYVVVESSAAGAYELTAETSSSCAQDADCGAGWSCQRILDGERWCLPEGSCTNAQILQPMPAQNMGDTTQGSATHTGSCAWVPQDGYASGKEDVWGFIAPSSGMATVAVSSPADVMFYVRSECSDSDSEITCAETKPAGQVEQATFAVQANQAYYVLVDTQTDVPGVYSVTLTLP